MITRVAGRGECVNILQQMMRHEQIETTLRYYVGTNAESVARTIHEARFGNNPGNSPGIPNSSASPQET